MGIVAAYNSSPALRECQSGVGRLYIIVCVLSDEHEGVW